ncbi:GntR family transcriptional regulator [Actinoplanes friuliensis]|uniref:Histidine utilization repressor n=1 Tax=Actinoplanes friuliensis DSM 7358 TaxID=1246995 RepID=U5W480_9ACTN|nr:GntR family transcriptional regulator [Actinoplanes friuliensis]AGZ43827.1 Histidine utilization repressor [Actinoplanes friuliensis DSM 7358]
MTSPPQLSVVTTDPTPPYEQVRRQLAELIGSGALPRGERLPPLRQLAGDLGLAIGTVARAYRELEAAGLVVSRRGGGTRVADRPAQAEPEPDVLLRAAEDYVWRARAAGASRDAILAALHRALEARY